MKNLKSKKTIHVFTRYFYPVASGIETNIFQIYGNLVKNSFDVSIHTSRDTLTEKNILADFEKIDGINVKRYKFNLFGFFPRFDWSKTDIVCLHNFNIFPHFLILLYSLFLKIFREKKFVLILITHGGYNPDWEIFPKFQAIIKKFYHYTLGTFLINKTVDGIRAVSNWERKNMIKHGINPNLIKVINNGIEKEAFYDLEKFASKQVKSIVSRNQPYIIQVGRIHPIKNYETAIRALAELPKNLNFLIVGPDQDLQYKVELQNLIKKLELEKRIKFLGVVRGVDKYYLLKHAELMVHMANWEAFCNTVHEGMSQGRVCIVSDHPSMSTLVKNQINGYILAPKDYLGLTKIIVKVLQNNSLKKSIGKINTKFAKNHSWENIAGKVESFYLKTLNQK